LVKIAIHTEAKACAVLIATDTKPTDEATYQLILTQWGSSSQPAENVDRVKRMRDLGTRFCEPFRSAYEWVSDDVYIYPDQFSSWNNSAPWDNRDGKVTLAGDAAHPMTPFRGQGLNNALQDAAAFVKAIKSVASGSISQKEAIDTYDKEVYERGVREIMISMKQGYAIHDLNVFMQSPMAKAGMTKGRDELKN
jgi:2-polyprenyl-6-methoxyphenol hydroxylase-like FAD-dependent oxidoreductase